MPIITNTPIWVWLIFIFLIIMGARQLRPRTVNLVQLLIVPTIFFPLLGMSILQINGMLMGFIALIIGVCSGILIGKIRWQSHPLIVKQGHHWLQKASVAPLLLYVFIFINRYITTALPHIEPNLAMVLPSYIPHLFIGLTGLGIGCLLAIVLFRESAKE